MIKISKTRSDMETSTVSRLLMRLRKIKVANIPMHQQLATMFPDKVVWGDKGFSRNLFLTRDFILANNDKEWSEDVRKALPNPVAYTTAVGLPSAASEMEGRRLVGSRCSDGSYDFVTITPQFVAEHLDYDWYWKGPSGLCSHPLISPAFALQHPSPNWVWGKGGFSKNLVTTPEFVNAHITFPWEWGKGGFSDNPSMLTIAFLQQHPDKPWHWARVCRNIRN